MGGAIRAAAGQQGTPTGKFYPDWRGQIVVIAASGPSQNKNDLEQAKGKARLVVINETWRLAPWADLLYACDERWWRHRGPSNSEFKGLRVQGYVAEKGTVWDGCQPGYVRNGVHVMQWDQVSLGAGGNSGFQALNLALAAGARRVVLTGYDMGFSAGQKHWHEDHTGALTNPDARLLKRCAEILDRAASDIARRGVEVINASRVSALKAYRRATIEEALA